MVNVNAVNTEMKPNESRFIESYNECSKALWKWIISSDQIFSQSQCVK